MTEQTTDNLISWPRVQARLGDISRSTGWRLRRTDKTFPKAIPLGPRRIAWRESEIQAWIDAQAAKVHA